MRLVSSKMPGMRQCALRPRPALPNRLFSGGSPGNPGEHPHPGPYPVPVPSLPGPLAAPPQVRVPQQAMCAGAANPGCLPGAPGCCGNGSARFREWEDRAVRARSPPPSEFCLLPCLPALYPPPNLEAFARVLSGQISISERLKIFQLHMWAITNHYF